MQKIVLSFMNFLMPVSMLVYVGFVLHRCEDDAAVIFLSDGGCFFHYLLNL